MKIADIERQAAELETVANREKELLAKKVRETEEQKAKLQMLAEEQAHNRDIDGYADSMAEIRKCEDKLALCQTLGSVTAEQQIENKAKMESLIADANKAFRKETDSDWSDILRAVNKAYEAEMSLKQKKERAEKALSRANNALGVVSGVSLINAIPTSYGILIMIENLKKALEEREKNEKKGIIA